MRRTAAIPCAELQTAVSRRAVRHASLPVTVSGWRSLSKGWSRGIRLQDAPGIVNLSARHHCHASGVAMTNAKRDRRAPATTVSAVLVTGWLFWKSHVRIAIAALAPVVAIAMSAGSSVWSVSLADASSSRAYQLLPADEDWRFWADPDGTRRRLGSDQAYPAALTRQAGISRSAGSCETCGETHWGR